MKQVQSLDGTRIAYEQVGSGPPVILIAGAFCDRHARASGTPLAALLRGVTAYSYDRRGRGDSTDTAPWSIEREVEDLAALITRAGGRASLYGMSSGAVLALEAAARGLAIERIALYEPPVAISAAEHARPVTFADELAQLCAAGKKGDAAALFLTKAVGVPEAQVANMRRAPMWSSLERIASTLEYDARITADPRHAIALAPSVQVRTLVLGGSESPRWLRDGLAALATALPNREFRLLAGQTHDVAPEVLAPALSDFFG